MRVLTRGDLDGLTGTVLLTLVEKIGEIRLAHPKDVQDGKVPCTKEDIIVNLPYVKGCGLWFDHHVSEEEKLPKIGKFKGAYKLAPSAARVIHDYYRHPDFARFKELLEATDRLDSAKLTVEDVTEPDGWIMLGYTLDPRSGLSPDFQKYFRWLVEFVKEVPIEKILKHAEVKKRVERLQKEQAEFERLLKKNSRQDGNVIVTDLREAKESLAGNRFLVYILYPEANVEVRMIRAKDGRVAFAIGHSIFNRTCKTNIGRLCASLGGGGHAGAGTCQVDGGEVDATLAKIVGQLKSKG
jgi:hypothetical protein